jgi:hypothetical protein
MKELLYGKWRGVRPDTLRFYALLSGGVRTSTIARPSEVYNTRS